MNNRAIWIKLTIFIGVLALIYGVIRFFHIDYTSFSPQNVRDKILAFGIWAPIVYIVFYTLRPLILFPAGLLTITGGLAFGPLFGTIYTVIGGTGCAVAEFFFARYFGRGAAAKLIKGKMAKIDEGIEKHGFITVLWIRLIPNVAYDIQNYSLGLTKVRFRDYFLATAFGIIPGTFAFVYLGSSLTDLRQFWKVLLAIFFILALIGLQKFWRSRHPQKS